MPPPPAVSASRAGSQTPSRAAETRAADARAPGGPHVVAHAYRGEDAYERWMSRPGGQAVLFDVSGELGDFEIAAKSVIYPNLAVSAMQVSGLRYDRTPRRIRRDGVNHLWFELNEAGGAGAMSWNDEDHRGPVGSLAVAHLGRPLVRRSERSRIITLILPSAAFPAEMSESLHGRFMLGPRARMLGAFMRLLARGEPGRVDADQVHDSAIRLATACATGSREAAEAAADVLAPLAVRQAQAFIDANLSRENLPMEAVVRATGVSRATLYRLFAPYGGLARFTWGRRLDRAREMIMASARPPRMADISDAVGFTGPAHFSAAFKERFGVRPSDLVLAPR